MDLSGPGPAQQINHAPAGGAPDDGIVDQHDTLALHQRADGVELDVDAHLPQLLGGRDKGAPNILIFGKADPIGDPGRPGISQGGVQSGVWDADDHVGLHRVLGGKESPGPLPCGAHRGAVDHRVRPCKVNELKDTQMPAGRPAAAGITFHAVIADGDDLAGADVPDEPGSDGIQRTAFRGKDRFPVCCLSHTEGAEAVGIPGGDQLGGRGDHQRIGPLDPAHGGINRLLDGRGSEPLLHDDIGDHFAVGGGVEDGAALLQPVSQLIGIGQIPVVGQGHPAFMVIDDDGLSVALAVGAGGSIADVSHDDVAGPQLFDALLWENLVDQPLVAIGGKHPVIIDRDPRALLPPVLEGKQPVIGQRGHIGSCSGKNAKDTTLFPNVVFLGNGLFNLFHVPQASS